MSLDGMKMNQEVTILIPYHACVDTFDYIKRQLTYYSLNDISVQVVLAVSGDERVIEKLEKFVTVFNNTQFTIIMTKETDQKNFNTFNEKIIAALQCIKTPYVVLSGADDLIIPEAAIIGAKILEKESEVNAVVGATLVIDSSDNLTTFCQSSILDNSPSVRMRQLLNNFQQCFYNVRRKEELLDCFNKAIFLNSLPETSKNPYHLELAMALNLVISGKIYKIDDVFMLRNVHSHNHTSYVNSFDELVKNGSLARFSNEYFQICKKEIPSLSYGVYNWWFLRYKLRYMGFTFKQVVYNLIYKKCGIVSSLKLLLYCALKHLLNLYRPCVLKIDKNSDFYTSKYYRSIKDHYLP